MQAPEPPLPAVIDGLRRGRAFDFQCAALDYTIVRVFSPDAVPERFRRPSSSNPAHEGPADAGSEAPPLEEPWRGAKFKAFGLQGVGDVLALGGNDFTFPADVGASINWFRARMPNGAATASRLDVLRTALTDYQLRRQRLLTVAMELCQRESRTKATAPVTAYFATENDLFVVESGTSARLEEIMSSYQAAMAAFPRAAAALLGDRR